VDREEISQILIDALGGGEDARITIDQPKNEFGKTKTIGTAREVAEHLADCLLNAGLS
jgi:hypothetical protein